MTKAGRDAAAWAPRRRLAWFVRGSTVVVPLLLAVVTMVAVALLAGFLPARRAAGTEPMTALRYE